MRHFKSHDINKCRAWLADEGFTLEPLSHPRGGGYWRGDDAAILFFAPNSGEWIASYL
jgi:hypothetical protein